ncbi:hypothetical protein RJP21_26735 [Paenibacillus sp. VCA1]|uniref:hypothetical protein n=1 Tax=Paenibacillus sp. VCA1 TaxID=3039148 RepID=UPI0028715084|nr:hypothetical protein [Paenibacillus sp. VCA1]MDR9857199.1 hypothetical protein [Paenibacillus sp. VCA1]
MAKTGLDPNILCVPIQVQAMMIGKSPVPTVFANIPDDFSRIVMNPLGDQVPSGIMSEKTQERPGVHLSWILPEGLRQGFQKNENQEPEYPRVPNRWIVSRLWSPDDSSDVLLCKHWIVESDALENASGPEYGNEGSLTYPKLDDPKRPFRILGRSYPYESILPEPEERLDTLNALGPGNPAFSAMYPYHINVFGFYDDLMDAAGKRFENISISYVVRGFYQNGLTLVESADICRERYGWEPPDGLMYPASLALHGLVTGLNWTNDQHDYNGPVIRNLPMPKLAVGNTSAEAVSALHGGSDGSNEHLMRVLLNDQSHKLLNLNGIYQADYADHDRRFQMVAEQNTYKLQSKINDKGYKDLPDLLPMEQILFRNLQQGTGELYKRLFDTDAKRSKIYDLWCKYMIKAQVTDPFEIKEAKKWMEQYQMEIEKEIQALELADIEIEEMRERLKILEQQLTDSIQAFYEVQQTAGSRFYEPNSPVLLLSGANRGTLFDTKLSTDERNLLKCRLLQETVQALQFDFTLRGSSYSAVIRTDQLLPEMQVKGNYPELLLEGALFCRNSDELVTTLIGQQLGLLPFSQEERIQLVEVVRQTQREMTTGLVEIGEVFPDRLFLNLWKSPWNPVLLCWRGLYYPDKELVGSHPKLSNWTYQRTDYVFDGPMPDTKEAVVIEGKIFLTPHIAKQLHAMAIKQLGTELAQTFGALDQMDYLSQALNGFNERFLMSQLALRFPVMVFQKGSAELAEQVSKALTGFAIEKPLFNTFFSPLRGGFFKFDQLRLIDTFGQFQNIDCNQYAIAEDLRMTDKLIGQLVMLPPRFMQPTRLGFNWIRARSHEFCDFNLPDSPICGWMIPNHADQSLLIYDEEGVMLGSLVTTAFDGDRVQWRNAPGMPFPDSEPFSDDASRSEELPAAMNADMKAFLSEILRRSHEQQEDVLTPFLHLIDSALWDIHQPESASASGLSLFVGKPLVLAKANVKLIQAGPPEGYKLLESNNKKPVPVPDISIKRFEMPLWVGETHHTGDGTIGFFIQDGQSDYKQFNSAFAEPDSASDYLKRSNQIYVSADDQAAGTTLSLILDPLASIHLISGMLPVSEQRIPIDRIEDALDQLYLTLYAGPMLVGEESYVMPLTKLPNRDWEFVTPGEAEEWIETQNLQPSNGNAFLAKPPFRAVEGWLKLKVGGTNGSETSK